MKLIDKDALVAEIKRRIDENSRKQSLPQYFGMVEEDLNILSFLDTLEVKESKLPNPRFPHLNNIVDKVFGASNLESFEYEEAEQLVLLAKEELLKDLEVKEVKLDEEIYLWVKNLHSVPNFEELNKFARHFFELGLKV